MPPLVPTQRRLLVVAGIAERVDADLRAGRTFAAFRGVHVAAEHAVGFLALVRAALATQGPLALVAMQTAAALLGLRWIPESWGLAASTVHIAVAPADAHRHRRGLRLHRRSVLPEDVVLVNGIACMNATRTLVELARNPALSEKLLVAIVDGALRDERTTLDLLRRCLDRFPGERGIARARRVIGRARLGVDSPKETELRLILEDGGLPCVEPNIEISDDDGLLLARGDLGIRKYLIWGEYDGFEPHTKRDVFRSDRPGDRWLHRRGWHVMRFVDTDLARPAVICREWAQAIAEAPARISALASTRSPEVAAARRALGFD